MSARAPYPREQASRKPLPATGCGIGRAGRDVASAGGVRPPPPENPTDRGGDPGGVRAADVIVVGPGDYVTDHSGTGALVAEQLASAEEARARRSCPSSDLVPDLES